jgi:hypothetical protein
MPKRKDWANANTSYAYVVGTRNDGDARQIVLFEKLHSGTRQEGIACVFGDTHMAFMPISSARTLILQQTGKTLEEWSGLSAPAPNHPTN